MHSLQTVLSQPALGKEDIKVHIAPVEAEIHGLLPDKNPQGCYLCTFSLTHSNPYSKFGDFFKICVELIFNVVKNVDLTTIEVWDTEDRTIFS